MKRLALVLLVGLLGCNSDTGITPTASPSPEPSVSPTPVASDCDVTGLDLSGKAGTVPVYVFPLNQFVTISADYRDRDQRAAALADCPNIGSVEQWALLAGHGDLYGNVKSPEVVLVASEPGDFVVKAIAFDRTRTNLVEGEWHGRAKLEGVAEAGTQAMEDRRQEIQERMLSLGFTLLDSK